MFYNYYTDLTTDVGCAPTSTETPGSNAWIELEVMGDTVMEPNLDNIFSILEKDTHASAQQKEKDIYASAEQNVLEFNYNGDELALYRITHHTFVLNKVYNLRYLSKTVRFYKLRVPTSKF